MTQAQSTRAALFGRTVRIDGTSVTAVFSPPQLVSRLDDSTVRVDRYQTTLHVLKSVVPTITTAEQWIEDEVVIELPSGSGWRTYRLVMKPTDGLMGSEWKLEIESL